MVRVPFDGFELGPPPQPAITSTRGAAQAKSERRSRVISTIQDCSQLYVPGVSASPREAPVCVSRKSYGRERRTGTKHHIDEEVARKTARMRFVHAIVILSEGLPKLSGPPNVCVF